MDCVHLLLDAGADVEIRDNQSRTALYYAPSTEVIHFLVERGLSLEHRDSYCWSPLVSAVTDGELSRVRAFIEARANVNATHDRGYTVFMAATSSMGRDREILETLWWRDQRLER